MSYTYQESHKHRLAKELLFQWLTNIEKGEGFQPELPFGWRTGNYGVHMELPFHTTDSPYYFETSGFVEHSHECHEKGIPETPYNRGEILFVPDICIFHKGTCTIIIEVVHTCPVSPHKMSRMLKFFDGYHLEVYQIEADNILSQTNLKCNLQFDCIYNASPGFSYGKPRADILK